MGQSRKQKAINKELNAIVRPLNSKMKYAVKKNWGDPRNLATFITMFGENYPMEKNQGIIFYGRATNGWDETKADFQMADLDNGDKQQKFFFQLMKAVASSFYPNDWQTHIAWSNVYKMAPSYEGNPNDSLCEAQEEMCKEIIKKEIEYLSPKVVVLITGNTASNTWHNILEDAMGGFKKISRKQHVWGTASQSGKDCSAFMYEANGTYFLLTDRPEYRRIDDHAKCLIDMIKKVWNK